MIHAKLLHQPQPLLDGTWIGGSTQSSKRMVIGIALQQHLAPVEFQPIVWTNLYGSYTKFLRHFVGHTSIVTSQCRHNAV